MNERKNDIHSIEKKFDRVLVRVEKNKYFSKEEKKRIKVFVKDCIIGKNSKKKVGKHRLLRYIDSLIFFSKYFKKDFMNLTEKEIEKFYLNLQNDKITPEHKERYTAETKNEFLKALRKYGGWIYKNNKTKYNRIFGWVKDFKTETEIPALTRQEVEKMANASDTRDKALILFMFDTGTRAEELLNIKIEDLTKKEDYYMVRIKISKTKPRTILIPLCSKEVEAWLNIHPTKNDTNSFLFPISYDGLRAMLNRKGKIIGKRVYPHLLRHSSATYYANRLKNPFKLDKRYGWIMGSKMSSRYIDREGISEEETKEVIEKGEINNLKKQNREISEEMALMKENFRSNINSITEELAIMLNAFKFKAEHPSKYREMVKQARKKYPELKKKKNENFLVLQPELYNQLLEKVES